MTSPVAARPQTHIQSRIQQELELQQDIRSKGGPGDMSEIDRELTMAQGAIHGVEQRIGELAARLKPVLDPKAWAGLMESGDHVMRPDTDDWEPQTEYGRRLRELQYQITGLEHALSYLGQGVRT